MRRKEYEIKEITEIIGIIDKCKVFRIALADCNNAYIVPLNFGYLFENEVLCLFFHGAPVGRKIELLKKNPYVCFEMDFEKGLVKGEKGCKYRYLYRSVIGEGPVSFIKNREEKKLALNQILRHQTESADNFLFDETIIDKTAAFKLTVRNISGKANY